MCVCVCYKELVYRAHLQKSVATSSIKPAPDCAQTAELLIPSDNKDPGLGLQQRQGIFNCYQPDFSKAIILSQEFRIEETRKSLCMLYGNGTVWDSLDHKSLQLVNQSLILLTPI